jgi:hypothetical protein
MLWGSSILVRSVWYSGGFLYLKIQHSGLCLLVYIFTYFCWIYVYHIIVESLKYDFVQFFQVVVPIYTPNICGNSGCSPILPILDVVPRLQLG